MAQTLKKMVIPLLAGLFLFAQSGCVGPSEATSSAPVSQPAGTPAGTPAAPSGGQSGVEVIRQPTAEVISTELDGFAPDDLEVITPENADRLQELAVIGPGQFMENIVVSPDGEYVAVALTNGVLLYDPVSGELVDFYTTSSGVIDMAVSPDGRRLATVTLIKSDEHYPATAPNPDKFVTHPVLTIWDRATDEAVLVQPLQGRGCGEYDVNDLVFSPHGMLLAFRDKYSLMGFTETDNLCVISAGDGSLVQTIPFESPFSSGEGMAFADEGQALIVTVSQNVGEDQYLREIHKYDLESVECVQAFETERNSYFTNLVLSPDGQWLAGVANQGVQIYTMADGSLMSTIRSEAAQGTHVVFSPDGQTLAYSLADNVVGLATLPDGTPLWENSPLNTVYMPASSEEAVYETHLAFSPEGDRLFVYPVGFGPRSVDSIRILDATDGHERGWFNETNAYISKALSPDGSRVLFGGYPDGEIQLWSVPGNQRLWSAHEHTAMVVGAAFSLDGEQIATASLDGSVRLWRAVDGTLERTLSEALGPTWHVAYAPDGRQLVTLSEDGTLRLWDAATGELTKEISAGLLGPWQSDMFFTPGGEAVLAASGCWGENQCQDYPSGGLRRVDLATGKVDLLVDYPVYHFTLSADQSLAGMETSQGIQTFDLGTLQTIRGHISSLGDGALAGAGVSPDGSLFLSGNVFGLHVWDTASGQSIGVIEGTQPIGGIVFNADQRLVSVSSKYGLFSVWGVPAE